MKKILLSSALAVFGYSTAATAATVVVDFEQFSHGDVITQLDLGGGVIADVTANGRSRYAPDEAWIFDTTLDDTRDSDLEGPFTSDGQNYDIVAGNALIIQEHRNTAPDDDGNGGWINLRFSQAVSFLGFDFLDDEDVIARDNNGNRVLVGPGDGSQFDNYWTTSGPLAWSNVTNLRFNFGHDSGAIDNLRFEVSQVPVPASLPLLLVGVGALGFVARRRKAA